MLGGRSVYPRTDGGKDVYRVIAALSSIPAADARGLRPALGLSREVRGRRLQREIDGVRIFGSHERRLASVVVLRQLGDRALEFTRKSRSDRLAPIEVPLKGSCILQASPFVKLDGLTCHWVSLDEILLRTSSHGTVFAFSKSMSAMRRAISSPHAFSAPSTTVASRLSRRELANSAHSSSESESAFWSSSRACCVME